MKTGQTILTLSWAPELPSSVYYRRSDNEKTEKVDLAFSPENLNELAVYRSNPDAKIPLVALPRQISMNYN